MSGSTIIGPNTVEVSGVDKELEKIWKTLAPPSDEDVQPVMHASVVNLVVVADTQAEADSSIDVLARVMSKAPCRAIVLDSQPNIQPPKLEAYVSIVCEKVGERQICCEHIRILAQGIDTAVLPRTLESFYTPDLPILVWWQAALDRPDLPEFSSVADRLVIDSRYYTAAEMQQLAALVSESHHSLTAVSDLNWARLTPYRQLFTQFFDSIDLREHLKGITSFTIEASEPTALLVKGWLLSRVGGEPYNLKPDQIIVNLRPDDGLVFRSLSMRCKDAEFSVLRASNDTVEARAVINGETSVRVARVPLAPVEKYLTDEIGRAGRDRGYDLALKIVAS
jgi:glucose-6-phosphate dehydrogenase assembly protein OpcA